VIVGWQRSRAAAGTILRLSAALMRVGCLIVIIGVFCLHYPDVRRMSRRR
jgi:hypothetical protein